MRLTINPHQGVGPVTLGSLAEQAERELRELDEFEAPAAGERRNPGFAHFTSGLSIQLHFDGAGTVHAIEVFRPEEESDSTVILNGTEVFRTPATVLVNQLATSGDVELLDDGLLAISRPLQLSFWRPVLPEDEQDEDGRYFESVLVADSDYPLQ